MSFSDANEILFLPAEGQYFAWAGERCTASAISAPASARIRFTVPKTVIHSPLLWHPQSFLHHRNSLSTALRLVLLLGSDSRFLRPLYIPSFSGVYTLSFNIAIVFPQRLQQSSVLDLVKNLNSNLVISSQTFTLAMAFLESWLWQNGCIQY